MRVCVVGLGYVGSVVAASLCRLGHTVTGVDLDRGKVAAINEGRSPVLEPGLDGLIRRERRRGRLSATSDPLLGIAGARLSLICVGTPSDARGEVDLRQVTRAADTIAEALAKQLPARARHTIAVRSTVPPGTTETVVHPRILSALDGARRSRVSVIAHPEFLREGTALRDFFHTPYQVLGATSQADVRLIRDLYEGVPCRIMQCLPAEAELLKYSHNAFHALKVTFANEIGILAQRLAIDSHRVMEVFCQEERLSISSAYLRPGFAFGGSCLPKDLRFLMGQARGNHQNPSLFEAILRCNAAHIERAAGEILRDSPRHVTLSGLSFKHGTDDLRESPYVLLAERLQAGGAIVTVYDPDVRPARIMGANLAFVESRAPWLLGALAADPDVAVAKADVVVIGKWFSDMSRYVLGLPRTVRIIDLVRVRDDAIRRRPGYYGLAW